MEVQQISASSVGAQPPYTQTTLQIVLFLLGAAADSPARHKLAAWPAVKAYLACGWCVFQGHILPGSNAMRFAGYAHESEQNLLGHPALRVGDARVQLTDALQRERAELVDQHHQEGPDCGLPPKYAGCNGLSVLAQPLTYASYNDLFILPIFHAGVLRLRSSAILLPHAGNGPQACMKLLLITSACLQSSMLPLTVGLKQVTLLCISHGVWLEKQQMGCNLQLELMQKCTR